MEILSFLVDIVREALSRVWSWLTGHNVQTSSGSANISWFGGISLWDCLVAVFAFSLFVGLIRLFFSISNPIGGQMKLAKHDVNSSGSASSSSSDSEVGD